jgi:hypothetical protein
MQQRPKDRSQNDIARPMVDDFGPYAAARMPCSNVFNVLGPVLPCLPYSYESHPPFPKDRFCFLAHPSCCFDVDFLTSRFRMYCRCTVHISSRVCLLNF